MWVGALKMSVGGRWVEKNGGNNSTSTDRHVFFGGMTMTDASSSATGGPSIEDRLGRDECALDDDNISKDDDGERGKADDNSNDEDDDLFDVVFPVVDDDHNDNANDDAIASSSLSSTLEEPRDKREYDEEAVSRCFYLSVDSHVDGVGDVIAFEAISRTT